MPGDASASEGAPCDSMKQIIRDKNVMKLIISFSLKVAYSSCKQVVRSTQNRNNQTTWGENEMHIELGAGRELIALSNSEKAVIRIGPSTRVSKRIVETMYPISHME